MAAALPTVLLVCSTTARTRAGLAPARLRDLLADGWDAHLALDGAKPRHAVGDDLSDPEFAGRVHLSPERLEPGVAARARLPLGVARSLARSPRDVGGQLLAGTAPRRSTLLGREVAAVLLTLRPRLVHFDSFAAAAPRLPAARTAGSVVLATLAEIDLEPPARERTAAVASAAAGIEFPSEAIRARADGLGARPADALIVASALPSGMASADPPDRAPRGDRPLHVLSAAPISWRAGYEWALQTIRSTTDAGLPVRYRIVGEGEHEDAVWFARHDLGLHEEVDLPGATELDPHLRWADVYLDAAVAAGGGGHVAEAMAAGLPVVATERTECPTGTDSACMVVGSRDPDAMEHALARLAEDPELASRLGRAGREALAARVDPDVGQRPFVEMCRRALG